MRSVSFKKKMEQHTHTQILDNFYFKKLEFRTCLFLKEPAI